MPNEIMTLEEFVLWVNKSLRDVADRQCLSGEARAQFYRGAMYMLSEWSFSKPQASTSPQE